MKIIISESQYKILVRKLINEEKEYHLLSMYLEPEDYKSFKERLNTNGLDDLEDLFKKITSPKNMTHNRKVKFIDGERISHMTIDEIINLIKKTMNGQTLLGKFSLRLNDGTFVFLEIDDIIKINLAGESPYNTKNDDDDDIIDIETLLKQMNLGNEPHHVSDKSDKPGKRI
jgi:hypothetical protein